jgi:hypothetical protein
MKILSFFNEIVKGNPLVVRNSDYYRYISKQKSFEKQLKLLNDETLCHQDCMKTININHEMFPQLESCPVSRQDTIVEVEDSRLSMIPPEKRTRMNVYVFKKIGDLQSELDETSKELDYFYLKYKKYYDRFSISTIVLSSSLTLIESISMMFEPTVYTGVITIFISTVIAVMTSVLKFKGYKEQIEGIVRTTEKVHSCQAQLFKFDKHLKISLNIEDGQDENNLSTI